MVVSWNKAGTTFDNVLDAIGRTHLVRLRHIPASEGVKPDIHAKLEFMNPTGSPKDRIYNKMITEAMGRGDLRPGMEVLESSTGNAGIACVFVGRSLGFKVTIVMPEGMMGIERRKMMKALGGEVVATPGGESDVDLCLRKIEEMWSAEPSKYWFPKQSSNPDNPLAHFQTTSPEI